MWDKHKFYQLSKRVQMGLSFENLNHLKEVWNSHVCSFMGIKVIWSFLMVSVSPTLQLISTTFIMKKACFLIGPFHSLLYPQLFCTPCGRGNNFNNPHFQKVLNPFSPIPPMMMPHSLALHAKPICYLISKTFYFYKKLEMKNQK